jgi:hypothetical protein
VALSNNNIELSRSKLDECVSISREIGAYNLQVFAQSFVGTNLMYASQYEAALKNFTECLDIIEKQGLPIQEKVKVQFNIAEVHGLTGKERLRNKFIRKGISLLKERHRGSMYDLAILNFAESELILKRIPSFKKILTDNLSNLNDDINFFKLFTLTILGRYMFTINRPVDGYKFCGTALNTAQISIRNVMSHVNESIYLSFDDIDLPNKHELISEGMKQDPVELFRSIVKDVENFFDSYE